VLFIYIIDITMQLKIESMYKFSTIMNKCDIYVIINDHNLNTRFMEIG